MVQTVHYLIEFCYTVHQDIQSQATVKKLESILEIFFKAQDIFVKTGVRNPHEHPPCQHFLVHYPKLICDFGAPNGLCSSITESKHISAVKQPWRRSNRWNPLEQILLTNQRLDKLTAAKALFESQGILDKSIIFNINSDGKHLNIRSVKIKINTFYILN
jgi:hypothetical protein